MSRDDCDKKLGKVKCAEKRYNDARGEADGYWNQFLAALKEIAKTAADELGITDALKCFTKGDLGACGSTALNVLASVAGGLAGKIAAKYGLPWKWKKAYEVGKKLANAIGRAYEKFRGWLDAGNRLEQAERGLSLAQKSAGRAAQVAGDAYEAYLQKKLGGIRNFKEMGRKFDGAFIDQETGLGTWYETKSGDFWEKMMKNSKMRSKFFTNEGQKLQLARKHGVGYTIISQNAIPKEVTNWLAEKGISWRTIP